MHHAFPFHTNSKYAGLQQCRRFPAWLSGVLFDRINFPGERLIFPAGYHIGQYEAGIRFCDELLEDRRLVPPNMYDQILINRHECATKAAEVYSHAGEHRQKIKVYIP